MRRQSKDTANSKSAKRRSQQRSVSRKALVHGIANCMKCDWTCMDYNTVQRKACQHAKTTGHRVSVELGYALTYFG